MAAAQNRPLVNIVMDEERNYIIDRDGIMAFNVPTINLDEVIRIPAATPVIPITLKTQITELLRTNADRIIAIARPVLDIQGLADHPYLSDGLRAIDNRYVLRIRCDAINPAHNRCTVLLATIPQPAFKALAMLPVPFPINTITNYAGLINQSANLVPHVVPAAEIPQAKHLAIHCDYEELVTVLATATIPIATRVLSAVLFAFPHMYSKAEVTPYANAAHYRAALDQTAAANYATPCDHRFMCLISLYLLGPSHTTDHKLPVQILKRMSAAFAGTDLLIPTAVELTAVIQTCLWKSGDIPALVCGILGRVLSVNNDLEYIRLAHVALRPIWHHI